MAKDVADHPTPMLRLLRQRVYDSRSIWDDEPPPDEQLESGLSVTEAIALETEVDGIVADNARLRWTLEQRRAALERALIELRSLQQTVDTHEVRTAIDVLEACS